jgi:hypothetical protein
MRQVFRDLVRGSLLPADERVELARELLRGLPDDVDELEDDLDRDELRRRILAVAERDEVPVTLAPLVRATVIVHWQ